MRVSAGFFQIRDSNSGFFNPSWLWHAMGWIWPWTSYDFGYHGTMWVPTLAQFPRFNLACTWIRAILPHVLSTPGRSGPRFHRGVSVANSWPTKSELIGKYGASIHNTYIFTSDFLRGGITIDLGVGFWIMVQLSAWFYSQPAQWCTLKATVEWSEGWRCSPYNDEGLGVRQYGT